MMDAIVFSVLLLLVLSLRGSPFHNLLVENAADVFREEGFEVAVEHPITMSNGRTNFVDIKAVRGCSTVLCEIETTSRNAVSNIQHARQLGLPLIVLVPNRRVAASVRRKLKLTGIPEESRTVCISLPSQLREGLTRCFPYFSAANRTQETETQNTAERR